MPDTGVTQTAAGQLRTGHPTTFAPIVDATPLGGARPSLAASLAQLRDGTALAHHSRGADGGVAAAGDVARLLFDTRVQLSGDAVTGLVLAPSVSDAVREYLAVDVDAQLAAHTGRFVNVGAGAWYRAAIRGPYDRPSSVSVELVIFLVSGRSGFGFWNRCRYDLMWEPGLNWRLVSFGDGAPTGPTHLVLTQRERVDFLPGGGWARLDT